FSRPDIQDWQPIFRVSRAALVSWAATLTLTIIALVREERPRVRDLAVVCTLAIGSFLVSRLDAFFVLAAVMLLAPQLARLAPVAVSGAASGGPTPRQALAVFAIPAAALVSVSVMLAIPNLDCVKMSGDWLPEREAGALLASGEMRGRMLTWFDWG